MKNNNKHLKNGVSQEPGYKIKVLITFRNGVTQTLRPTRKSKIARNVVLNKMKSGHLRVEYGPDTYNEGTYYNKTDFLRALNEFTEPELIKQIRGSKCYEN